MFFTPFCVTFSKCSFRTNKSLFLFSIRFIFLEISKCSFIYAFCSSSSFSFSSFIFANCSFDLSIFVFCVFSTICSSENITLSYSSKSGLVQVGQFDSRPSVVIFSIFFFISAISFSSPAISCNTLFSSNSLFVRSCLYFSILLSNSFSFSTNSKCSFVSNSNTFILSFAFVYCSLNSFCSKSNPSFLKLYSFSLSCSFKVSCRFIYSCFIVCKPFNSSCFVYKVFSSFCSFSCVFWWELIVFFRSSHLAFKLCFCSFVFVNSSNSCFIDNSFCFNSSKTKLCLSISFKNSSF